MPALSTVHDAWLAYLSSLAGVLTAGSSLMIALAVIRIQSFVNALGLLERSIAEAFYNIGRLDAYLAKASPHYFNDEWQEYITAVKCLADQCETSFRREGPYSATKTFVTSMAARAQKLQMDRRQLERAIAIGFVLTGLTAGIAILAVPAVLWVSVNVLLWIWLLSGACALILLILYMYMLLVFFIYR